MYNIIEDVAKLTTIKASTLNTVVDIFISCIVDGLKEDMLDDDSNGIVEFNIGIGILKVKRTGREFKYLFTPSDKLNKNIKKLLDNKLNSLEEILEKSLSKKLTSAYKDLL